MNEGKTLSWYRLNKRVGFRKQSISKKNNASNYKLSTEKINWELVLLICSPKMNKNGTSRKKIDCLRNGSEKIKRNWISMTTTFLGVKTSKTEKASSPIGCSIDDK